MLLSLCCCSLSFIDALAQFFLVKVIVVCCIFFNLIIIRFCVTFLIASLVRSLCQLLIGNVSIRCSRKRKTWTSDSFSEKIVGRILTSNLGNNLKKPKLCCLLTHSFRMTKYVSTIFANLSFWLARKNHFWFVIGQFYKHLNVSLSWGERLINTKRIFMLIH